MVHMLHPLHTLHMLQTLHTLHAPHAIHVQHMLHALRVLQTLHVLHALHTLHTHAARAAHTRLQARAGCLQVLRAPPRTLLRSGALRVVFALSVHATHPSMPPEAPSTDHPTVRSRFDITVGGATPYSLGLWRSTLKSGEGQ